MGKLSDVQFETAKRLLKKLNKRGVSKDMAVQCVSFYLTSKIDWRGGEQEGDDHRPQQQAGGHQVL